jgi:hypothetical protein
MIRQMILLTLCLLLLFVLVCASQYTSPVLLHEESWPVA